MKKDTKDEVESKILNYMIFRSRSGVSYRVVDVGSDRVKCEMYPPIPPSKKTTKWFDPDNLLKMERIDK